MDDHPQDVLRADAVASLKRKRKFWTDAFGYLSVNGVLWVIWALADRSTDNSIPWPAWVTLVWGLLLLIDGIKAFGPWPSRVIDEAAVEREMRRLAPH